MKTVLKLGRPGLSDQSGRPQSCWASLARAVAHKAAGPLWPERLPTKLLGKSGRPQSCWASLTRAAAHKAAGPERSPMKLLGLSGQSGRPRSCRASLTRAAAHEATGLLWPERSPTQLLGLSDQSSRPQSCAYAADFHSCVQNQQDINTHTTSITSSVALPLEWKTENIRLTWPVLAGFHKYPHHRRSRRVWSPGGTLLL